MAALCGAFFAKGWITRTGTSRPVVVTQSGEQALSWTCPESAGRPSLVMIGES